MQDILKHTTQWVASQFVCTSNLFEPGILLLLICLEPLITGWRQSSLHALLHPKTTDKQDLLALALRATGIRGSLAIVFYLGMSSYISRWLNGSALGRGAALTEGIPFGLTFLLALIAHDFLSYWTHRLQHWSDWLWNLHEFHHSATKVSLATTYRSHPMFSFLYELCTIIPIQLLFGNWLVGSIAFLFISNVSGMINHSRIDTGFGWLGKYIFVSPRVHHSHHGRGAGQYKNFGEIFIIWDRFFRTYETPPATALDGPQGIENNFYEEWPPVKAYLWPMLNFYHISLGYIPPWLRRRPRPSEAEPR